MISPIGRFKIYGTMCTGVQGSGVHCGPRYEDLLLFQTDDERSAHQAAGDYLAGVALHRFDDGFAVQRTVRLCKVISVRVVDTHDAS